MRNFEGMGALLGNFKKPAPGGGPAIAFAAGAAYVLSPTHNN